MNYAHIHLILNHIPVVGIPIALAFLVQGIITKNLNSQRFSFLVLVALAALVVPVYFTGEPAEEVIEHMPGVTEEFISAHEDAALVSLLLTVAAGAIAGVALIFGREGKKRNLLTNSVVGIAGIAMISLLYTANLGGKVRHVELRGVQPTLAGEGNEKEEVKAVESKADDAVGGVVKKDPEKTAGGDAD